MNYYKRHIGDYAKKTRQFTILEHGIYCLILDAYYDRESPITETLAIRLTGAKSADEIEAVKSVLRDCFFLENGEFHQTRADEEIAHFQKRQKLNRKLGKLGGLAKGKRNASESLSEGLASHKPLTINQEEEKERAIALGLPSWIDPKVWEDFQKHRRGLRAGMSAVAEKRVIQELEKLKGQGHDPNSILNASMVNGWKGVFPPKPNGHSHEKPQRIIADNSAVARNLESILQHKRQNGGL